MKAVAITSCPHCKGTGRVPLTGVYADTLQLARCRDMPEAFTCLESNRDILSIVYDPTGNAMTHGDIVDTLNALQAEVYQLRADVGRGEPSSRHLIEAMRYAVALADTGSPQHKSAFDPDNVGEVPPGWRVVERMRERLVDALSREDAVEALERA